MCGPLCLSNKYVKWISVNKSFTQQSPASEKEVVKKPPDSTMNIEIKIVIMRRCTIWSYIMYPLAPKCFLKANQASFTTHCERNNRPFMPCKKGCCVWLSKWCSPIDMQTFCSNNILPNNETETMASLPHLSLIPDIHKKIEAEQ